ncbi:ROK family protein [Arthrobacter sp. BE255]|uniref:ROK family protein n=1 Tax=Arthrobacter sp. BE255 TaxID=2817721 RepID=UPI00286B8740|nr:ROK family protein [Arthrobacter sp. BE255]
MYTIGADLGATKLAMALVSENGEVMRETWVPHRIRTSQDLLATFELAAEALLLAPMLNSGEIRALGVSCAGWINPERTILVGSAILGLESVPLTELLSVRFPNATVVLQNDGDATLWGEYVAGAASGAKGALLFTLGSGVGGSIMVDGRLLKGANGFATELGHMPVAVPPGLECACGSIGCLETVAGGRSLERTASNLQATATSPWLAAQPLGVTAREMGEAAEIGDQAAVDAFKKAAIALADAIAMLIPVVDPDVVVIGGSVAEGVGHLVLPTVREHLNEVAFLRSRRGIPSIVQAELGPKAAVIGAADFARRVRRQRMPQ